MPRLGRARPNRGYLRKAGALAPGATTYEKLGTAAAEGAAAVVRTLDKARTGTAATTGAGSGVNSVERVKAGTGASPLAANGARQVERPKAGTAVTAGTGAGVQTVTPAAAEYAKT